MKVALKKTTLQTAEVLRPPSARQAEILVKKTCQIGNLLFADIVNSVKDPIFQPIPETKKTYEYRSV